MDEDPETQFAWAGPDRVAYQVCGAGDVDVLFTVPSGDSMEMRWYWPPYADFIRRLGCNARVIMFDRRLASGRHRRTLQATPGYALR